MNNNEILLNRMYAGKYLDDETNIGHEVINLFKADNGRNYIYINHLGYISNEHDDKINIIFLVRLINQNMFEILAKAEELEQLVKGFKTEKDGSLREEQRRYIRENNIKYGGRYIDEIYEGNYSDFYFTFCTSKLRKARAPIYITDKESLSDNRKNIFYVDGKNFSRQSLKMYYGESKESKGFATLQGIAKNDGLWEKGNMTRTVAESSQSNQDSFTFLSLIRREYDELAFSNMIKYYLLKSYKAAELFMRDILKIDGLDTSYEVVREEHNIDIIIRDNKSFVVIENKIKSEINGADAEKDTENGKHTQLSKYYEYARENADGREIYCYVFAPNYNMLDLDKYIDGERYKIISYEKLLCFFTSQEVMALYKGDKYYNDFCKAIRKHASPVDNEKFEIMQRRFFEVIKNV